MRRPLPSTECCNGQLLSMKPLEGGVPQSTRIRKYKPSNALRHSSRIPIPSTASLEAIASQQLRGCSFCLLLRPMYLLLVSPYVYVAPSTSSLTGVLLGRQQDMLRVRKSHPDPDLDLDKLEQWRSCS